MIILIWAMDTNFLIGKDNKLPWRYKEDLKYFKATVENKTVLMGDMTYLSLKGYYKDKPLPYGKIYVASKNNDFKDSNVTIIDNLEYFLKNTKEDIYVIGGRTIYQVALPYADRLYITHILKRHEGNIYFPKFDLNQYKVIQKRYSAELIFSIYEKKD
ncbi:Dihydrofolate reductase [Alteracholeplasma palmae J233]|uniref:dihydrofolate reductase n=1 Tax=Alteracholeplasma palmae (strain ATCC 49389 / J233) TaxID=1318466 RepID=U4KL33_ALTPJ|nr:dihydrofolate reductase [Alteracholeplasma palmae]CCV64457.1 Dihydrofolate reductase [Alteracholeplasma palmae J233]